MTTSAERLSRLLALVPWLRVNDGITLELGYRYSDLGSVRTDVGQLYNVTSRGARNIPIAGTEADLVTQSVTVSARFGL